MRSRERKERGSREGSGERVAWRRGGTDTETEDKHKVNRRQSQASGRACEPVAGVPGGSAVYMRNKWFSGNRLVTVLEGTPGSLWWRQNVQSTLGLIGQEGLASQVWKLPKVSSFSTLLYSFKLPVNPTPKGELESLRMPVLTSSRDLQGLSSPHHQATCCKFCTYTLQITRWPGHTG